MRVFFDSKNVEKLSYGRQKRWNYVFREKIFEKPHGPYQSCKKQKIRYNLIKSNLLIYNDIELESIKNHVILRTFAKKILKNGSNTTPLSWSLSN